MTHHYYLAARYSRLEELCRYRDRLRALGKTVTARWLDGSHQIDTQGNPIGESGEQLVEQGNSEQSSRLRAKLCMDDVEDVMRATYFITFTEPPRSAPNRGGRHVEFGLALANCPVIIVIGPRENLFHWHPKVQQFDTWDQYILSLSRTSSPSP